MSENASSSCTMFVEINSKRFPLDLGQIYLLGKQLTAAGEDIKKLINLEDKENVVDQKHCVLEVGVSDDVFIFDLLSSKGTFLNNKRLKSLEKIQLKNGDIFKVGGMEEVKFHYEHPDVSHDSSGFLDANKNTSDIIVSSPESMSQREIRMKRLNNNNFLVPAVPAKKLNTPNNSFIIPETENNTSKISLNVSLNNRRSDSFTIPETQYCKPRGSINSSDLSIAESNPDENISKNQFNINLDDDDDDEFCIPETQEVMTGNISLSQRPRLLNAATASKERSIIEEKSVDLEDDSSNGLTDGSQFRICTQDYNEGFGEEESESLTSQIIPLIKHNTIILNSSNKSKDITNNHSKLVVDEIEKEMSAIRWSSSNIDNEDTRLRANCTTPDIFDFDNLEGEKQTGQTKDMNTKTILLTPEPNILEDEEDLLPTQVFPSNTKKLSNEKNDNLNQKEKPILEKENEDVLTLSDKENRRPGDLEPITDLPPTQLFAINEGSSARSSYSSTSRKSNVSTFEANLNLNPSTSTSAQKNKIFKNVSNPDHDEDDLLTQAFLPPLKPPTAVMAKTNLPVKCFNSTLLDDKSISRNHPATFFAEMEKTPSKTTLPNTFKMPEKEFSLLKKASSATSTASESDLDLLMCTPQLIADHIQVGQHDELKRSLLAAKNRNLFGIDTDEEDDESKTSKDKNLLVELINIPKESKDFDKLLPHLKDDNENRTKRKSITDEQKAAKEAYKEYKFMLSFGHEQEENKSMTEKSSTLSRDERHAARDKEREVSKQKEQLKKLESSKEEKTEKKRKTRKTKTKETDEKDQDGKQEHLKQERPSRAHKRLPSTEKQKEAKDTRIKTVEETKKETKRETKKEAEKKETKKEAEKRETKKEAEKRETKKETEKEEKSKKTSDKPKETKSSENKKSKETINNNTSSESEIAQIPTRRITRLKSRLEENPSTSKEALAKESKSNQNADDLDIIPTQPYVRSTRSRSSSKHSESQDSITSNTTSRKTAAAHKAKRNASKDNSSNSSPNTSTTASTSKTNIERKRKADPPAQTATKERKRLRSTNSSQDLPATLSNASPISPSSSPSSVCLISMTMVDPELFQELTKNSTGLWSVAKNPADSKILVMDKAYRTFKFLLAMARGIPIVTSKWLKKINETKSLKKAPISDYIFSEAEFEKKHKFSLIKSLHQANQKPRLFEGYEFLMTSGILPNPPEIKAIVEVSGGCVHLKAPPPARDDQKIFLVSSPNDKKDWHKYRRLNKNIRIISTEAIMSAVMRQSNLPLFSNYNCLA